jgi:hypothetical protein
MNALLKHFAIDGRLIIVGVVVFAAVLIMTARFRMHRTARSVYSVFDLSASCISGRHRRCDTDVRCPCKCHEHSQVHAAYVEMSMSDR